MTQTLLTVEHLTVSAGQTPLLQNLSFTLKKKETLGLVGESGSGKSMTAWSLLGLLPPGVFVQSGKIIFKGDDLRRFSQAQWRVLRGKGLAMIFQNPQTAFNPLFTVGKQMDNAIAAHFDETKKTRRERAMFYLRQAELSDSGRILKSYPFQLSGGMLQRVSIALALSLEPELLIADEPTTALDATIQFQILNLLQKLQKQFKTAMLVISHHFGVVSKLCTQIAVMYNGRIVEAGLKSDVLNQPLHPYTRALLASRPVNLLSGQTLKTIPGTPPAAGTVTDGCAFAPRCSQRFELCDKAVPPELISNNRRVACFLKPKYDAEKITD